MAFLPGATLLRLHGLADDCSDSVCRCLSHLRGGVSVGGEGEAGAVVPQGAGEGFDVDTVFQGQGGKGVPEVVETDVFRSDGLQYPFVKMAEGVRVMHPAGF